VDGEKCPHAGPGVDRRRSPWTRANMLRGLVAYFRSGNRASTEHGLSYGSRKSADPKVANNDLCPVTPKTYLAPSISGIRYRAYECRVD
jgi:hypothetical protein